jgi:ATP-dependent helicase HrpB
VWTVAARECERIAAETSGDMLVFMPGAYEIGRTVQEMQGSRALRDFICFPLHGELPPEQQDRAVARYEARKIIVSTNVAETSLTIDGVTAVVDCGLARVARFDPHRGINTLLIEKISVASADQRAGRAGRTAPGVCVRLWTERDHAQRARQELPEIKRLDLAEVVLTLKASGIDDVAGFPWLEKPEAKALARAETLAGRPGGAWAGRDWCLAITETGRPQDAALSGAPAVRTHVSRGAGARLRARRRVDGGADPGEKLSSCAAWTNGRRRRGMTCSARSTRAIFSC